MDKLPVIFLMGATASGKTDLAIALHQQLPVDIISVDSALVYRHMNIGTAKPTAAELAQAPHRLIDICDPDKAYSVADFCRDAEREITAIHQNGRVPLLVGGTMMYFKALLDGLAEMPAANPDIREAIEKEAAVSGWPALHQQLQQIDPEYAGQLHPNHSQRIARALEVYRASGKTMTQLRAQQDHTRRLANRFDLLPLALWSENRHWLHQRIAARFILMLQHGFVDEVQQLRENYSLAADMPSMRAVGYRQVWQFLDKKNGYSTLHELENKGVVATRQLAKRQLTWLRNWENVQKISVGDGLKAAAPQKILELILNFLEVKRL